MGTNFEDVGDFHAKFNLPSVNIDGPAPRDPCPDLGEFRINFMQEELDEFIMAYENEDIPEMFDALLDLVYVAMGTAHIMGLPWQEGWDEVQRSNMAKERATAADMSKRNSEYDVIKPEGWIGPRIADIVEKYTRA